jgi:hypothetical protein
MNILSLVVGIGKRISRPSLFSSAEARILPHSRTLPPPDIKRISIYFSFCKFVLRKVLRIYIIFTTTNKGDKAAKKTAKAVFL